MATGQSTGLTAAEKRLVPVVEGGEGRSGSLDWWRSLHLIIAQWEESHP